MPYKGHGTCPMLRSCMSAFCHVGWHNPRPNIATAAHVHCMYSGLDREAGAHGVWCMLCICHSLAVTPPPVRGPARAHLRSLAHSWPAPWCNLMHCRRADGGTSSGGLTDCDGAAAHVHCWPPQRITTLLVAASRQVAITPTGCGGRTRRQHRCQHKRITMHMAGHHLAACSMHVQTQGSRSYRAAEATAWEAHAAPTASSLQLGALTQSCTCAQQQACSSDWRPGQSPTQPQRMAPDSSPAQKTHATKQASGTCAGWA